MFKPLMNCNEVASVIDIVVSNRHKTSKDDSHEKPGELNLKD